MPLKDSATSTNVPCWFLSTNALAALCVPLFCAATAAAFVSAWRHGHIDPRVVSFDQRLGRFVNFGA